MGYAFNLLKKKNSKSNDSYTNNQQPKKKYTNVYKILFKINQTIKLLMFPLSANGFIKIIIFLGSIFTMKKELQANLQFMPIIPDNDKCEILEVPEGTKCSCKYNHYATLPQIINTTSSFKCHTIDLSSCTIDSVDANSFLWAAQHQTQKLLMHNTQIKFASDTRFLSPLKSLKIVEFPFASIYNIIHLYWPITTEFLNISYSNLTEFLIENDIPILEEIDLHHNDIKNFPSIKYKLNLKRINLDENVNIAITFQDLMPYCKMNELKANRLLGTIGPVTSKVFCDCVRLKRWLENCNVSHNIGVCKYYKEPPLCELNFYHDTHNEFDECGRKIEIEEIHAPVDMRTDFLFLTVFLVICALVIAAFIFELFIRKHPDPETETKRKRSIISPKQIEIKELGRNSNTK